MKTASRVATACLLACLALPQQTLAGGGMGEDPYEIGEKLYAKENYRTALKYFQKALTQNPGRADAAERVRATEEQLKKPVTELLARGKSLFKKKKYREAEKALLQAAAKDTSNPEIHFLLGDVYLQLEQYDKAKSEYNKAKRSY